MPTITPKTKKNVAKQAAGVAVMAKNDTAVTAKNNETVVRGDEDMQSSDFDLSIEEMADRAGVSVSQFESVIADTRKIAIGKKKTPGTVSILSAQSIYGGATSDPFGGSSFEAKDSWRYFVFTAKIVSYPDSKKLDNTEVSYGAFIAKVTKKGNLRIVYSHNCKNDYDMADAIYSKAVNELNSVYMFVAPSFED